MLMPGPHLLRSAPVIRVHPGVCSDLQKHLHGFQVAPKSCPVEWCAAESALRKGIPERVRGPGPALLGAPSPPCCWGWHPAPQAAGWPWPARPPPPRREACSRGCPRTPRWPGAYAAVEPCCPRRSPRLRGSSAAPPGRKAVSSRPPPRPAPRPPGAPRPALPRPPAAEAQTSLSTWWISPTSPSKAASSRRRRRCSSSRRARSSASSFSRCRRAASCSRRTKARYACKTWPAVTVPSAQNTAAVSAAHGYPVAQTSCT